jgi:hypothetical protein
MGCTHSQVRDESAPVVHKDTYRSHVNQTKADTYIFQQWTEEGYSMPEITITTSLAEPQSLPPRTKSRYPTTDSSSSRMSTKKNTIKPFGKTASPAVF